MKNAWKGVLFLAILLGCDRALPERTVEYYPLKPGQVWEYEVTETQYSVSQGAQKRNWYLREVLGDTLGEINGFPVYSLERYRKSQWSDAWTIDSVWTVYRQPDKLVKTENNTPYIKLRLPADDKLSWNGNALNILREQTYTLHHRGNGRAEVVQMADSSLIHLHKSIEQYQEGVGLVYRELRIYDYCQSTPECIGKNIISSGRDLIYKILP